MSVVLLSGRFKMSVVLLSGQKRPFAFANGLFIRKGKMDEVKTEENKPILCYVEKGYLKYMHSIDRCVSVKYNNRVFAGIVTSINNQNYVIPLTSQTTQERIKEGKKKEVLR